MPATNSDTVCFVVVAARGRVSHYECVDAMDVDARAEPVASPQVGRGNFSDGEWNDARERRERSTADNLLVISLRASDLESGFLEFGVSRALHASDRQ
jgi:hypothetical protein